MNAGEKHVYVKIVLEKVAECFPGRKINATYDIGNNTKLIQLLVAMECLVRSYVGLCVPLVHMRFSFVLINFEIVIFLQLVGLIQTK